MIIDISHHNGNIDWDTVKLNPINIEGVFIKSNQGSGSIGEDPKLKYNSSHAKRVGIPLSYYHFATLNSLDAIKDATTEANYFIQLLKILPVPDMELVLDIEENKIGLSPEQVLVWINTFFNIMKKAGYTKLMLYSYAPFLNTNLPVSHNLAGYPLWIASYSTKFMVPRGWLNAKLWQYSCTGSVSGIKGNVDFSKIV